MLVKKVPFPTPTEKRRQQPGTHCNQHHSITLRPLIDEDQWLRTTLIDKAFLTHEEIQVIDRLIVHQVSKPIKKAKNTTPPKQVMGSLCFKKICLGTKNLKKFSGCAKRPLAASKQNPLFVPIDLIRSAALRNCIFGVAK